ncbi:hypothetical protein [Mariniblastus fucicola]|uniref:Uncharacterized protein n=2 Tax=Mariniblastus fucicola TaxID=980251 RepID=A0A5B9PA43_9BACT|nr:hypothetical protein [Mariniblastus fucicola]QEG23238.1 hypothetical protein MFFC18_31340 [Mariniblastus fucicola]
MAQSSTERLLSEPSRIDSEANADHDAQMNQWLDDVSENWHKTAKKVRKTEPLARTSKKSVQQLCYGLDDQLVSNVAPLIEHVVSRGSSDHEFEQLASLSESIASSAHAFRQSGLESFTQEVSDAESANELPLLAALSALLVASRLRSIVLDGNDQHFERVIRSLQSIEHVVDPDEPDSVLLYQWLAIELPLTIASQLIAIKPFKKEGKLAAKRFVEVTRELLDSDAWPNACCLRHFAPLAASWTRCIQLAKSCNFKLGSSFYAQMEWVPEQFVRLHGPKHRPVLGASPQTRSERSFVEFVLQLDPDGRARRLAEISGLTQRQGKKKASVRDVDFVEPGCVSEWAESAILKSSWLPKSPLVALDFSTPHSLMEVSTRERLIQGALALEIRDDGQPVDLSDASFEVVCELSNEEVSYLELELKCGDLKLYRQLLLSKQEHFLFFADAVFKSGAGELDYRLKVPLAKGVDVVRENGTRELYLSLDGKGIQSLVLPISLPEWSSERCRGLLSASKDETRNVHELRLERAVQLQSSGGALYSPMFIDLDPKRSHKKRTWRSLTVAEGLQIVRPEVAAAFRVQVDEQQWVFYRALQSIGNRTFLGQNFAGDFFAARFNAAGQVSELVEVE